MNKNIVAAILALILLAVVVGIYLFGTINNANQGAIGITILVVVVIFGVLSRVLSELELM